MQSETGAANLAASDDEGDGYDDYEDESFLTPRLSVHAHLNQAFGIATGLPVIGLDKHGTADYRTAALQVRLQVGADNALVVQLSHKRIGDSRLQAHEADIELDWAFYEYRFAPLTWARVGRIQLPIGIYNELRDVGVALPLFRAPVEFYGEGVFLSETVDGIAVSHTFLQDTDWPITLTGYFGSWDLLERAGGPEVFPADVDNAVGFQLWLGTPVEGLRLGFHANRLERTGGILDSPPTEHANYYVSLDGNFSLMDGDLRLLVRAEFRRFLFEQGLQEAFYAQLGVTLFDGAGLLVQAERSNLKQSFTTGNRWTNYQDDLAFGLSYRFTPSVVLKSEFHLLRGYNFDEESRSIYNDPPGIGEYLLVSLAVGY